MYLFQIPQDQLDADGFYLLYGRNGDAPCDEFKLAIDAASNDPAAQIYIPGLQASKSQAFPIYKNGEQSFIHEGRNIKQVYIKGDVVVSGGVVAKYIFG